MQYLTEAIAPFGVKIRDMLYETNISYITLNRIRTNQSVSAGTRVKLVDWIDKLITEERPRLSSSKPLDRKFKEACLDYLEETIEVLEGE